jgi:YD repeat-containing protein
VRILTGFGMTAIMIALTPAAHASETITYSYDALGRLGGSTISGGPNSGRVTATSFSPAGNRTSYVVSTLSERLRSPKLQSPSGQEQDYG